MFERFAESARLVLVLANDEARSLGQEFLGTEHLLLGLAADDDSPIAHLLAEYGLSRGRIRSYILLVAGASAPRPSIDPNIDAAALATLGIDLDEVRRRVEDTFGAGALAGRPSGIREACSIGPFTPPAKQALELALHEARRERSNWIAPKHLALGLLRADGTAARLLAHHRVTRAVVQAAPDDGPNQLAG